MASFEEMNCEQYSWDADKRLDQYEARVYRASLNIIVDVVRPSGWDVEVGNCNYESKTRHIFHGKAHIEVFRLSRDIGGSWLMAPNPYCAIEMVPELLSVINEVYNASI